MLPRIQDLGFKVRFQACLVRGNWREQGDDRYFPRDERALYPQKYGLDQGSTRRVGCPMTNIHVCLFASQGFKRQQDLQRRAFLDVGVPETQTHCGGPEDLGDDFFHDLPYAAESNRFGHFSFKPYVLLKALERLQDGEVLLYLDANDCPLPGICDYVLRLLADKPAWNVIAASTNYTNARHTSWYHRQRSPGLLAWLSSFHYQPEAGALVIRSGMESQGLMRVWYALTALHSHALQGCEDRRARHDQETLFQLAQLNNSVLFESWWRHRLFGHGLRKYVDWEFFRNAD